MRMTPLESAKKEEGKGELTGNLRSEIKEAADGIIKEMESSSDPKFRQSKFLRFVRKIKAGAYNINADNTLEKDPKMLAVFHAAQMEEQKEKGQKSDDPMELLDKYWNDLNADIGLE